MRTTGEILEMVHSGERPEYDELRLVVRVLDALHSFDWHDLSRLAESERRVMAGEKPFPLLSSPSCAREESWNRLKRALAVPPDKWLEGHNPDDPEYQKRRTIALRLVDRVIADSEKKEGSNS